MVRLPVTIPASQCERWTPENIMLWLLVEGKEGRIVQGMPKA